MEHFFLSEQGLEEMKKVLLLLLGCAVQVSVCVCVFRGRWGGEGTQRVIVSVCLFVFLIPILRLGGPCFHPTNRMSPPQAIQTHFHSNLSFSPRLF